MRLEKLKDFVNFALFTIVQPVDMPSDPRVWLTNFEPERPGRYKIIRYGTYIHGVLKQYDLCDKGYTAGPDVEIEVVGMLGSNGARPLADDEKAFLAQIKRA